MSHSDEPQVLPCAILDACQGATELPSVQEAACSCTVHAQQTDCCHLRWQADPVLQSTMRFGSNYDITPRLSEPAIVTHFCFMYYYGISVARWLV